MVNTTKLTLKNMIFYGHHGVFAAEKELGQQIEVDVEVVSDFENAGKFDDFKLTINYVGIYTIVKEIVEQDAFDLIEAIAVTILKRITEAYSLEKITVRVRKPHPPVGGLMDGVEFEISRERDNL